MNEFAVTERRWTYEQTISRMSEMVHRNDDGTLELRIDNARDIDAHPIAFADLSRSLDETNRKIMAGEIQPDEIHTQIFYKS